jgi:hypothetical protein
VNFGGKLQEFAMFLRGKADAMQGQRDAHKQYQYAAPSRERE